MVVGCFVVVAAVVVVVVGCFDGCCCSAGGCSAGCSAGWSAVAARSRSWAPSSPPGWPLPAPRGGAGCERAPCARAERSESCKSSRSKDTGGRSR